MKQYLKLLMTREGKEVLGKGGANLWLLTLVLVATFASIAFSEGSMIYLQDKMEDPFTNWVTISKATDTERFAKFKEVLELPENKKQFGYTNVQMDQTTNWNMQGEDESHLHYLSARCFQQLRSNLVEAILDKSNVVSNAIIDSSLLDDKSLGFIVSIDAAKRLGYDEDHLPSYIHLMVFTEGADSLNIKVSKDGYNAVPLPVLAVVRRLPNNVDIMASNYFYDQRENNTSTYPFAFVINEVYQHQLRYFVSEAVGQEKFQKEVESLLPDSLKKNFKLYKDLEAKNIMPWKAGSIFDVFIGDERMPREIFQNLSEKISEKFDSEDVRRVHKYNVADCPSKDGSYISIEFADLAHIREFESFAKEYAVQLDMAQVASKENFQAVTVIARILSAAMVIFSIVCIIMFLVNMLQGYFQKVQRNIGTFKAFGMNARELIYTYVIILILIVITAVISALILTWIIQAILPVVGIQKEGFNYLSLWNATTCVAAIVVMASTVITVVFVMIRMLGRTPGDLIYDRN